MRIAWHGRACTVSLNSAVALVYVRTRAPGDPQTACVHPVSLAASSSLPKCLLVGELTLLALEL